MIEIEVYEIEEAFLPVSAIKLVHEFSGLPLRDAKQLVERLIESRARGIFRIKVEAGSVDDFLRRASDAGLGVVRVHSN